MTFDPKKHLIRIQGNRDYLPVAARLIWFRQDHPDWGIVTSAIEISVERQYAIFSCSILNAEGRLMATATKMENVRGFADYIEKAETGAVGRALAYVGYGTQFAPELEEAERFADAPYANGGSSARASGAIRNTPQNASQSNGRPAAGNGIRRIREPERALAPEIEDEEEESFEEADLLDASAAPPIMDAADATPAAPRPNVLAGNRCSVEGCPNVLTAGQMTMTVNKFGRPLCLLHQRDAAPLLLGANGRRPAAASTNVGG